MTMHAHMAGAGTWTAPKVADKLIGLALAAKLALLFVLALNTRFVMDEFWQFGQAKYLFDGFFETIWPAKAVGYALFYKLSHWIGWDAQSMLLAGRLQTALLGCATVAMVYFIARALGEERTRALLIILILVCFTTFMERIFRMRSDPLALFFATAALLVLMRGRLDGLGRLLLAGALSGLAFLSTQKAIYFNVALGLALLGDAALARSYLYGLMRGVLLVCGWMLPVSAYLLYFGSDAGVLRVAQHLFFGPAEIATRGQAYVAGIDGYIWQTLSRNFLLYAACFAGLGIALARLFTLDEHRRVALVFTTVMTLLVFLHNQPWPYVFIFVLPFLALWPLALLDAIRTPGRRRPVIIALALIAGLSFGRNITYLARDNDDQLRVVSQAESLLEPGETYFDGIGMLPNRRQSARRWLDGRRVHVTLSDGQRSDLYQALESARPKAIIWTYRTTRIAHVIAPLIERSYVSVSPNILLTGRNLDSGVPTAFDVPVAGRYRLYDKSGAPLEARIQVNGEWQSAPVRLAPGHNVILAETGIGAAYLLPDGLKLAGLAPGAPARLLFEDVYD